jgi:CubicO group peptidase (beta-lactamase class C family)
MTRRDFTKTAVIAGLIGLRTKDAYTESNPALNLDEPIDDLERRISRQMPTWLKSYGVPGLSLLLIREGEPQWKHAYGIKEFDHRQPVDVATIFEASSLGKPVVAFAALTLVKEGRLDLDRPIGSYLDTSFQNTVPDDHLKITARNVLAHTTGLPNMRVGPRPPKMIFAPGERFSYSGEGFSLLQEVMQQITGKPLDVLCQDRVFEPLKMTHTSMVWKEEYENTLASGYGKKLRRGMKRKMPAPLAPSSLTSSPTDYGKFLGHILQSYIKPIGRRHQSVYRMMLTPQIDLQADLEWGLGWGLQTCQNEKAFWHWGNNADKYHSFAIGYPEHGLGLVVMTNSGNGLHLCRELVPAVVGGCHPSFGLRMVVR